jgi:beta-aspartyl-peptidase (threonine type)
MKKATLPTAVWLGLGLAGASLVLFRTADVEASDGTKETTNAVRGVLDAQVAAWNRGDLEGFMEGYWHSLELSFFSGKEKKRGWQETLDRYRKRYQSGGQSLGKLSFKELEIQPLSPEAAWVRGRFELVTDKETLTGLFTLIFKKKPEGWRIVHDHTSG